MWGIFTEIINVYMADRGIIDSHLPTVTVILINFMCKAPKEFVNLNINGKSPMNMTLEFIQHVFTIGKTLEDEITSMSGVTLIIALLEHVGEGMRPNIHTVNQMYLHELATTDTRDYKNMIIQGIMMNFWFDQATTMSSFLTLGELEKVFNFILSNVENMENDFEIKRVIIGLSSLTLSPSSSLLDQAVQTRFNDFIHAILFLCQKSLQLRERKNKRAEECLEDKDCEAGVIYDEDEDEDSAIQLDMDDASDDEEWDPEDESDEENIPYKSIIDSIDDVLYVQQHL
jgi:hypothetical protein